MKLFYSIKDLQEILGLCKSSCYEIMNKLQEEFIKDNPNCVVVKKKIPARYFEEKY